MATFRSSALGRHWLIELYDCRPALLGEVPQIEQFMREAAGLAGAHIVSGHFHQFSPYGVSGVLVIQESHLTIHTWPEYGYAAVDIFTCSPDLKVELAIEQLQRDLGCRRVEVEMMERGNGRLRNRVGGLNI